MFPHKITAGQREQLWKIDDAHVATIYEQIQMGQNLARISPNASYLYASTALAKTGIADYQGFLGQVSHWNRKAIRSGGGRQHFVYHPKGIGQSMNRAFIDVMLLIMWNVLLFMGANMAFLYYDVR